MNARKGPLERCVNLTTMIIASRRIRAIMIKIEEFRGVYRISVPNDWNWGVGAFRNFIYEIDVIITSDPAIIGA